MGGLHEGASAPRDACGARCGADQGAPEGHAHVHGTPGLAVHVALLPQLQEQHASDRRCRRHDRHCVTGPQVRQYVHYGRATRHDRAAYGCAAPSRLHSAGGARDGRPHGGWACEWNGHRILLPFGRPVPRAVPGIRGLLGRRHCGQRDARQRVLRSFPRHPMVLWDPRHAAVRQNSRRPVQEVRAGDVHAASGSDGWRGSLRQARWSWQGRPQLCRGARILAHRARRDGWRDGRRGAHGRQPPGSLVQALVLQALREQAARWQA